MFKKGLKNLIILLLAPIGALILFYLSRDFSGLAASVLDISEMQRIQENGRSLAYKTSDQLFEVFPGEGLEKSDLISFQIIYDPQNLTYDANSFSGLIQQQKKLEDGVFQVDITLPDNLSKQLPIFAMSFSGDQEKILLGEAKASNAGKENLLTVGNLNINQEDMFLDN